MDYEAARIQDNQWVPNTTTISPDGPNRSKATVQDQIDELKACIEVTHHLERELNTVLSRYTKQVPPSGDNTAESDPLPSDWSPLEKDLATMYFMVSNVNAALRALIERVVL